MSLLTDRERKLLYLIVHSRTKQSRKVFDKRDYCFQKSIRCTAKIIGKSKSAVDRLFQKLKSLDLVRKVIDSSGQQMLMLKPNFIRTNRSKYEEWYLLAMYYQGSDEKAQNYALQCRTDGVLYDCKVFGEVVCLLTGEITYGEVIRQLTWHEGKSWYQSTESYTSTDRAKRRNYCGVKLVA
ncbi:hypothetical protein FLM48_01775 [Shewanella sp. Scap07]|uniref:hypothetical protein n=1 Tax=Shewanella sp. Scap07 TaxID=2589987 RepID=UPI0015BCB931|nr:hypothetical protein [Shewanella sp. Scap07]QLE83927.1 hypothetical protein FLM48_01775 [Shewanella sp. Scap07]